MSGVRGSWDCEGQILNLEFLHCTTWSAGVKCGGHKCEGQILNLELRRCTTCASGADSAVFASYTDG